MTNEYTAERLMQWGADCSRENNGGLGMALMRYAEAWQRERDALRAENERLRETLIAVDRRISEANQWDWVSALQLGRDIDPRLLARGDQPPNGAPSRSRIPSTPQERSND